MPNLFEDSALAPAPDSGLMLAPGENVPNSGLVDYPPGTPGIGVAPGAASQAAPELRNTLSNAPLPLKALIALGAGADAYLGRKPVLFSAMEADRRDRLEKSAELRTHMEALQDFSRVAKSLSGDAKTNFVEDGAKQLNEMRAGLGDTFRHVAEQPGLLDDFQRYMPYLPQPMQLLIQRDPDKALVAMNTSEGLKATENARQQYLLKIAGQKATATVANAQQLEQFGVPKELIDTFLKSPTASNLNKLNQALPADHPFRLSADQMQAVDAHGETFYPAMGVMSPKGEQEVLKKREEDKITHPEGHAPQTRTVTRGTKVVQQDFINGEWTDREIGEKFNPAYKVPKGYEVDPDDPTQLRPVSGGPKDQNANPQRDKMQADALAMYRANYPMGKIKPSDPTAEEYVANYLKERGPAPAPAGAPQSPQEYQQKFGKPPPSIGNKEGFDKLKKGDGYIDSRDGKYKVKG